MKMYDYECPQCKAVEERLVVTMDELVGCGACGAFMTRLMPSPSTGQPAYQMKGILRSGEKVPGHFGKDAAKRKRGG